MRKLFIGIMCCFPFLVQSDVSATDELSTQFYCYDTEKLFTELRSEYLETPFLMGETSDVAGSTMSLWMSKNGQTWTIVATKKDLSCVVGAGKNLRLVRHGKRV